MSLFLVLDFSFTCQKVWSPSNSTVVVSPLLPTIRSVNRAQVNVTLDGHDELRDRFLHYDGCLVDRLIEEELTS